MIPLSEDTKDRIRRVFSDADTLRVENILLNTCGDTMPGVKTEYTQLCERVRFAVLKLSKGNLAELERNIKEAHIDWRDVLMAAGFGERIDAHKEWVP